MAWASPAPNLVPTAERLAPFCRVFVPDLPGYGDSDKPSRLLSLTELADSLVMWMNAAGLERAAFLGNSFGCQVMVDLAVRYPQRVESLVLQGPTVDPKGRSAVEQLRRWQQNSEPAALMPLMARDYRKCGISRVIGTFKIALSDPIEEKLPYVQAPALVVRGSNDPMVPQRWAEEAVRLLPQGELRVIPGPAHTVNFAAPLELARVTLPFVRQHRRHVPKEALTSKLQA